LSNHADIYNMPPDSLVCRKNNIVTGVKYMKVKALLAIVASLSLAACAVPDEAPRHGGHDHGHSHGHNHDHGHAHQQQGGIDASFNCENGLSVHVRSLSTDSIELNLDDKQAVLKSAVAGSGERYTSNTGLFGKGAEWHQKGSEAFFAFTDPYGNKVETSCNAR